MKQQTNEEIQKSKRVLCYVCKKPIHIDEMGGVKGDGKGGEDWFHKECFISIERTRLSTIQEVEENMKSLFADELNGDYTEEEKKNPLVAYNAALKRVLQVLASMKG